MWWIAEEILSGVMEASEEVKPYKIWEIHRDLHLRVPTFRCHSVLNSITYNLADFLHCVYSTCLKIYLNIVVLAGAVSDRLTLMFLLVYFSSSNLNKFLAWSSCYTSISGAGVTLRNEESNLSIHNRESSHGSTCLYSKFSDIWWSVKWVPKTLTWRVWRFL